jgi:hypothetical protein
MTKDDIIRMAREAGFADGVAEIVGLEGFANFFADNKKALEAALEQQAEPVAWMVTYGGLTHVEYTLPSKVVDTHYQPLYDTLPQRKPLTMDEIGQAWAVADGEHNASAAVKRRITRAIEAAHGIKEGT